jgi:hypothetical protein
LIAPDRHLGAVSPCAHRARNLGPRTHPPIPCYRIALIVYPSCMMRASLDGRLASSASFSRLPFCARRHMRCCTYPAIESIIAKATSAIVSRAARCECSSRWLCGTPNCCSCC